MRRRPDNRPPHKHGVCCMAACYELHSVWSSTAARPRQGTTARALNAQTGTHHSLPACAPMRTHAPTTDTCLGRRAHSVRHGSHCAFGGTAAEGLPLGVSGRGRMGWGMREVGRDTVRHRCSGQAGSTLRFCRSTCRPRGTFTVRKQNSTRIVERHTRKMIGERSIAA